jgi:hypothetical protein
VVPLRVRRLRLPGDDRLQRADHEQGQCPARIALGDLAVGQQDESFAGKPQRAIAIGAVAVVLTALSLNHLATGIEIITHASGWEAMALAVGVDLGFVALEFSQLAIGDKLRRQVGKYARPAIIGTLVASAALNSFAFAAQASNEWMMAAAIGLGIAVPGMVFCLTKVSALMWIDCHARTA